MAMPALAPRRWTAAEIQALPDDPTHRYECVDGELHVSPSPRTAHQSAVTELALLLGPLVRSAGVGAVTCAPSDWVLDPHTLVQPDLFVVPLVERRRSIYAQQLAWQPVGAATPLVLDLERFFDEVLGPAAPHT